MTGKIKLLFSLFAVGTLLLCGCGRQGVASKNESKDARLARFRTEANSAALKEATNEITGLNKIIDLSVNDSSDEMTNWSAVVTAEYMNHVGGIDRTNLHLLFWEVTGKGLVAEADYYWMMAEENARYQQMLKDATNVGGAR